MIVGSRGLFWQGLDCFGRCPITGVASGALRVAAGLVQTVTSSSLAGVSRLFALMSATSKRKVLDAGSIEMRPVTAEDVVVSSSWNRYWNACNESYTLHALRGWDEVKTGAYEIAGLGFFDPSLPVGKKRANEYTFTGGAIAYKSSKVECTCRMVMEKLRSQDKQVVFARGKFWQALDLVGYVPILGMGAGALRVVAACAQILYAASFEEKNSRHKLRGIDELRRGLFQEVLSFGFGGMGRALLAESSLDGHEATRMPHRGRYFFDGKAIYYPQEYSFEF